MGVLYFGVFLTVLAVVGVIVVKYMEQRDKEKQKAERNRIENLPKNRRRHLERMVFSSRQAIDDWESEIEVLHRNEVPAGDRNLRRHEDSI